MQILLMTQIVLGLILGRIHENTRNCGSLVYTTNHSSKTCLTVCIPDVDPMEPQLSPYTSSLSTAESRSELLREGSYRDGCIGNSSWAISSMDVGFHIMSFWVYKKEKDSAWLVGISTMRLIRHLRNYQIIMKTI